MNKNISEKTLQDLEFSTVLQHVAEHCISGLGKEKVFETQPIQNKKELFKSLKKSASKGIELQGKKLENKFGLKINSESQAFGLLRQWKDSF